MKRYLCALMMILTTSSVWAQAASVAQYLEIAQSAMAEIGGSGDVESEDSLKGDLVKVRSPYTGQIFEVFVSQDSPKYKAGRLSVVCPYTGRSFFLPAEEESKEKKEVKKVRKKIRSPYTGQFFTVDLDIDSILAGEGDDILLTCPYTGKVFRFSVEPVVEKDGQVNLGLNFMMIYDKKSGKYFKIAAKNGKFPETVISPYTGDKISVPDPGKMEQLESAVERIYNDVLLKNMGYAQVLQFGYDVFPVEIKAVASDERGGETGISAATLGFLAGDKSRDGALLGKNTLHVEKETYESTVFAPITSEPVDAGYILGPDDTLILNIWGKVQEQVSLVIDRNGKVLLPKAGLIYLWGQTFEEAKAIIANALNRYYTNIEIDVTMGKLRTIRIYVFGNVRQPGAYIVSSRATAFHALFTALGPVKTGSLRRVVLKRKNETDKEIDLYSLLVYGEKSADVALQSEDILFVPPIGQTFAVTGEVKNPAIYEMNSPTSVSDALQLVGGFLPVANKESCQILRIDDDQRIKLVPLDYEKCSETFLQDGDLLLVPRISDVRRNYIDIEGHVAQPGELPYVPGMTLKEALDQCGGFLPGALLNRVEIVRKTVYEQQELFSLNFSTIDGRAQSEKFLLKEWDHIEVYSDEQGAQQYFVEAKGAVRNPGEYKFYKNMHISDLLFKAGGVTEKKENIKVELLSNSANGKKKQITSFNLLELQGAERNKYDVVLSEDDQVIFRSQHIATGGGTVIIEGQVPFPGEYFVAPGDRISDLIQKAGGFLPSAYLPGTIFQRESLRQKQAEAAEQLILDQRKKLLKEEAVLIKGVNSGDISAEARRLTLKHRQELLDLIASAHISGRLLIQLTDDREFLNSKYNILLKDGDRLEIPSMPSSVHVIGSVYNASALVYEEGRGMRYYLNKVGGETKEADKRDIYIVRVNGEVKSDLISSEKIMPGDIIVVPEKFKYHLPTGVAIKDGIDILYKLALGAAVVANLD